MQEEINSHIQMPESVLKRFENQHHQFYYYDVEKKFVGNHGHSGKINTQIGFYSKDTEGLLSAHVEKPFSDLYRIIDEICIDPPQGHIDSVFDGTAKRFVYALIARNPDNIDRIKEYPFLTDFLSDQEIRDLGMIVGFEAEIERDVFAKYGTTLAINTTIVPFILPTCGIYAVQFREIEHIVLPVSPQKAIVFVEERGTDVIIHDGIVHPYRVDDISAVQVFNEAALSTQCGYGNGYVVSPDRNALMRALEISYRKHHCKPPQNPLQ